jgi:putative methyltransferase
MSREYSTAGAAVDAVSRGMTYKAYCAKNRMGKIDFALASETLKYLSVISKILASAGVSAESLDVGSQGMVEVMTYELLMGAGKIRGGGAVKRRLVDCKDALDAALASEMKSAKASSVVDLLPEHIRLAQLLPQYLRVNPLQLSARRLQEVQVETEIRQQCPGAVPDKDIPHMWVLPLRSPSFGQHARVQDGCLIIQDKASCFPSQLLMDSWKGGDIIDACAAPGNKTSHMAALMHEQKVKGGTIYAFDKNPRRAELLAGRMRAAGADSIVTAQEGDFLALDVQDERFRNVRSVLLDPSCSGSGVARDLSRHNDESEEGRAERLDKLRSFQLQALRKALSFPAVTLVLYSTCSIHDEENESVVAEVLQQEAVQSAGWDVHAPARLQGWPRRGHAFPGLSEAQAAALVRCHPQDGLNGFFVAELHKRAHPLSMAQDQKAKAVLKNTDKDDAKQEKEQNKKSEKNKEKKDLDTDGEDWAVPMSGTDLDDPDWLPDPPRKRRRQLWRPFHLSRDKHA